MLTAFTRAFRTPDLRKKMLFTLGIIALFRLGSVVPTPGVAYQNVQDCISTVDTSGVYGLINLFSGGALLQLSIFALGIMPYITASIIVQLLTVVIPRFEALKQEGQAGRPSSPSTPATSRSAWRSCSHEHRDPRPRTGPTRCCGCDRSLLVDNGVFTTILAVITMTAGTGVIMWLGELITDRGVGNGMSLLIFTSIAATFPASLWQIKVQKSTELFLFVIAIGLFIVAAVVFVEQAQRRIPVQYAKRMIGRRMYGGTSTYIPLKVNQAGVIPVIFASSLLYLPALATRFGQPTAGWVVWVNNTWSRATTRST